MSYLQIDDNIELQQCDHEHDSEDEHHHNGHQCDHNHSHQDHDHNHDHNHDHDHHDHDHENFEEEAEPLQDLMLYHFICKFSDYKYSFALAIVYMLLSITAFLSCVQTKNHQLAQESFDCLLNALIIMLIVYCGVKAKTFKATSSYPFGMMRLEYLSAFTVCIHIILMSLFHFARNVHEYIDQADISGDELHPNPWFQALLRFVTSSIGLVTFAQYLIRVPKKLDQEQQQFSLTYFSTIGKSSEYIFPMHCTNMHALALLLFAEFMLSVGKCLDFIIDDYRLGTPIIVIIIFCIYITIKPLILFTGYNLLMANTDNHTEIYDLMQNLKIKFRLLIWGQSIIVNAKADEKLRQDIRDIVKSKFRQSYIDLQ